MFASRRFNLELSSETYMIDPMREQSQPQSPWIKRLHWGLIAALAVSLIQFLLVIPQRPIARAPDYCAYYRAAALIHEGHAEAIYRFHLTGSKYRIGYGDPAHPESFSHLGYIYPPPFAAVLSLCLPRLGFTAGLHLQTAAIIVSFLLSIAIVALAPREKNVRWLASLAVGVLALNLSAFEHDLLTGNINSLVLLSICLCFWAEARGRSAVAGVALAIASILKITPALLLLYFIANRKWKALAAFAVATIVIVLPTLPLTGIAVYGDFFQVLRDMAGGNAYHCNQSINGFVRRLFEDSYEQAGLFHNASLGLVLSKLLAAAVILISTAMMFRNRRDLMYSFSVLLSAVAIASPVTWHAHMVVLLLPLAWLIHFVFANTHTDLTPAKGAGLIASGLLIVLLLVLPEPVPMLPATSIGPLLLISYHFYGATILWATVVLMGYPSSRRRHEAATPDAQPSVGVQVPARLRQLDVSHNSED